MTIRLIHNGTVMSHEKNTILEILSSASLGDVAGLKAIARRIASEARDAGDEAFAEKIQETVKEDSSLPVGLEPLQIIKTLDQLRLTPEVKQAVDDFLLEQRKRHVLEAANLKPRHKALFMGPPGNGKTVLAGAISRELEIPAYIVRYDELISKVPGETSRNLLTIFRYAEQHSCMLFFDEFDALGREREDAQESGEMKRVTSTLLFQLDQVPSNVVCIAATNHAGMLDAAIWRRFNIRLELPSPDLSVYQGFMRDLFTDKGYPDINYGPSMFDGEVNLKIVALRMSPQNLSDADLFVQNCIRQYVLAEGERTLEQSIYIELEKWATGQKRQVA